MAIMGGLPPPAEAARVVAVDDGAAGEDHHAAFFGEGDIEVLPVEEVGADGVPPTHVAPEIAEGVVLVEDVPFAVVIDEAVGVVGPVGLRSEVELRAEGFVVGGGLREEESGERKCEKGGDFLRVHDPK